jgi:CubicO group peptidase (beta-lactamase class C family)
MEDFLAWEPPVSALAAQTPKWAPGTAHGYHAITYGWLVGEVVRRITGKSLGTFFAEEVAGPLGLNFWIGLPANEEHLASRYEISSFPRSRTPSSERHHRCPFHGAHVRFFDRQWCGRRAVVQ